jgi:hypothetical protein
MNIEMEQLSELMRLIEKREEIIDDLTAEIMDRIEPYVLDVLYELFNLPEEDVKWLDIQNVDNILMLTCSVAFDPRKIPPYIAKLFIPDPEDLYENIVHKMIRIGVPMALIFGPRYKVVEFFNDVANVAEEQNKIFVEKQEKMMDNVKSFRASGLTDEQKRALKMFSGYGKGATH